MLISADRVPAELERLKQGTLVQMSRPQFEALVERARQRLGAIQNPPQLVEARYQATLAGTALIGNARWRVVNPTPGPGYLPLQPWNLALIKARWPKGRADFAPALIASWNGQKQSVLVNGVGERTLDLDWTVRGDLGPAGLHFDIQIPLSPLASLELNLPSDQAVVSEADSYLVSGPAPADQEGRTLWRVDFAGQSKLDLMIRSRTNEPTPPLILSKVSATHEVKPDLVQVDFDLKLEVPHRAIQQPLVFEFDPPLRPVEVSASNLDSWELSTDSQVRVRLRRPFQGGSVQIRCLAPLSATRIWHFPRLNVKGAVPRGETIVLHIPASMQMKSWQPGGFRLTANEITSEGGQTLSLTGINLSPETSHRPEVEFQATSTIFRVRQLTWWQVGQSGSNLTEQLTYEITKGRLHQLQLGIPSGWEVERAESSPADLARTQTIIQGDNGAILSMELQYPLAAGQAAPGDMRFTNLARLNVILRPTHPSFTDESSLPIPDVVPIGARFREGSLAIGIDPRFQAQVVGLKAEPPSEDKGPWGKQSPDLFFSYHGQTISGFLVLKPRHLQFKARATSEVMTVSDHASQVIRLVLEPQEGRPKSILVEFSAPLPKKCLWRTTSGRGEVQTARRLASGEVQSLLACLAASCPLPAVTLLPGSWHGELWQLILDRPLQGPLTVEATFDLPGRTTDPEKAAGVYWDLPLPNVLQAGVMDGNVVIHSDLAGQIQIEETGLVPEKDEADSQKNYRYGPGPRALILRGPRGKPDRENQPVFGEQIQLDTILEGQGRQICRLVFEISGWPQKMLPIRLPPAARPVGALISGQWVSHLQCDQGNELRQVLLPIPSGGDRNSVELIYEIDEPSWILWSEVSLSLPELPVAEPPPFIRTCRLPPGIEPLSVHFWRQTGASTMSRLWPLDDSMAGWGFWIFQGEENLPIRMWVVRPSAFLGIGYGLALALFLAGRQYRLVQSLWFLVASPSAVVLLLLLPSGLRGLAVGPTLAVLILAVLGFFELFMTQKWGKKAAKKVAPVVLAIISVMGTTTISAQVGPFRLTPKPVEPTIPVYLLPGSTNNVDEQSVLLAPAALKKLRSQAGLGPVPPVLLNSRYEGRVQGSNAEFRAELTVFSSSDQPGQIIIPLGGIQLQEAILDGVPAKPVVLPAGELGNIGRGNGPAGFESYAIDVTGPGFHTLQLRFVRAMQSTGEERDLQFPIPEVAQNHLTLTAPGEARFLHTPGSRGRQFLTPLDGPGVNRGMRLDADLGQVGFIHVHWRQAQDSKPDHNQPSLVNESASIVEVREAYLWDLRLAATSLFSVLQYVVDQGTVGSLEVALPDPLEVRHDPIVTQESAASFQGLAGSRPLPRLKEWRMIGVGQERRLHLEFQRPLAGRGQISLELVPRVPLRSPVDLIVPSFLGDQGARRTRADTLPSLLAFRTEELQAAIANHLRITGIDANEFRDFWVAAGLADPGPSIHAFSFQRSPAAGSSAPLLRLQLQPMPSTDKGSPESGRAAWQDIHWLVKSGHAGFTAQVHLAASARDLAFVEFDLPPQVHLIDVTGPEVHAWSETHAPNSTSNAAGANRSRLQVWLQGMFADTTLELTGWMKLDEAPAEAAPPAPGASPKVAPKDGYLFSLPAIHLLSFADQRIRIQIAPQSGGNLQVIGRKNMWPPPNSAPSRAIMSAAGEGARGEEFLTDRQDYEGNFVLRRDSMPGSSKSAAAPVKE
jgi:hypothetical protein